MICIDWADWHYGNEYPENLPEENAGTHIGMYLNWIIDTDLIGEFHLTESADGINDVKAKKIWTKFSFRLSRWKVIEWIS